MKSKEDHIKYWIDQSEDDLEAVQALFDGRKYLQALFFMHLVIEKVCKALWILNNETNVPPKTHNLVHILSQTGIEIPDATNEFLLLLNRFQLEGRYPEYINKMYDICNKEFTKDTIDQANNIRLWLIGKLQ